MRDGEAGGRRRGCSKQTAEANPASGASPLSAPSISRHSTFFDTGEKNTSADECWQWVIKEKDDGGDRVGGSDIKCIVFACSESLLVLLICQYVKTATVARRVRDGGRRVAGGRR